MKYISMLTNTLTKGLICVCIYIYIYIYLHDIDLTRFVLDILKNSILSHTLVLKHMSKNTTL